ncbi:hypothetical protein PUNSTDRAFT_136659 [Punctularia strigosozonata HHB-11173 SS5]|uniref:uncharacterized protein n=1 Tax=Punctularia strigosozonata (strain HHB-11173) TaxID=741275 RepID=UPI0004416556|nr:uncharacterized protein PUNSTDRAFT_136659 [Punctularia strigosozonata HHB-11173 SS5]EIN06827.1 hypothetical protein PUNSTDRAFT_136659 [Punctularia strigosozonata HHB-11173 SS5]
MFSLCVVTVLAALAGHAAAQESHQISLTNNCGSGNAVFLYEANGTPQGSTTIQGQVLGGIAWIDGFAGANCLSSGVNCGAVEFTLRNDSPNQNAVDFTLEPQPENGSHQFTYPMSYSYIGGGACAGISDNCPSAGSCPNAFTDPTNGTPLQCIGSNAGIQITFC